MGNEAQVTITIAVPKTLKDELEQKAENQDRSVSSLVRVILKDSLGTQNEE